MLGTQLRRARRGGRSPLSEKRAASVSAWNRFWFSAASPLPLACFRILFAVCLAWEVDTTFARSVFAKPGLFHLPYADWIPLLSEESYRAIHQWQLVIIALIGLGFFTRTSCLLLLLAQGWVFFADQLNFRNHPYFFLLVLAILVCSPAGRALSLDAWLRHPRQPRRILDPEPEPVTAQRLIQVQVSMVYLWAALAKLNPAYLGGHVVRPFVEGWLHGRGWPAPAADEVWVAVAIASVVIEAFLGVALWSRRLRGPAMVLGAGFHLTIAVTMNIWVFSVAMIATYLLFLEPSTVAAPLRAARAATRSAAV